MEIGELFGVRKQDGQFGIEIEAEGRGLPASDQISKYFRYEADGSLRGESIEYVFEKPLSIEESFTALDVLYKELSSKINVKSPRTGVHVHLNIQNYSILDFIKFYTLYLCLENVLLRYCGKEREGNLFCLRSEDAEYSLYFIRSLIVDQYWPFRGNDNIRYSSLNINSVPKYGSLEFRSLKTPDNSKQIKEWINLINCLDKAKDKYDTPVDIIYDVSGENFHDFVTKVFGKHSKILSSFEDNWESLVRIGVRNAQLIAFCVDDWVVYNSNLKLKKKKNPYEY